MKMNTSATVTKRKESDENGHDGPPQKKTKHYSTDDIKQIEDLYNTILDIKSKLNAAYLENSLKLKKSFESIQLTVPELKQGFILPPMLSNDNKQQGFPSQSQKPSAEPKTPSAEPEKPSAGSEKPSVEPENPSAEPEKPSDEPEKPASPSKKPSTTPESRVTHKWMLKHDKPGPDLIELMPNTGIYVDRTELSRAKYKAPDMRKFGRALLPVVFSKKALLICSYTGLGTKEKRPGLDEYARNVFIDYVTKHAEESKWEIVSRKLMTTSMSSKVKDFNYYLHFEMVRSKNNPKIAAMVEKSMLSLRK